jgi:dTDP-4-dehydrorhamnose 3,5-epimerase-like enzyme
MRYVDVVYCVAGQIIDKIHDLVFSSTLQNTKALSVTENDYMAYHIRRGDFQHKHTQLSAETILENTLHLLPADHKSLTVYISTDEKNIR